MKQYLINEDLYNFFKLLRESNMETGGIYEKTSAQIIGNIQCCDGSKLALGYFIPSAVKTKRIFIDHFEQNVAIGTAYENCGWTTSPPPYQPVYYGTYSNDEKVWATEKYCADCRLRGTNVKPDFWE